MGLCDTCGQNDYELMWKILKMKVLNDSINFKTGVSNKNGYTLKELLEMMELVEEHNKK